MKEFREVETGFLLSKKNAFALKKDLLSNIRTSLRALIRIGVLKHKEAREIEYYIDTIIYKIKKEDKK